MTIPQKKSGWNKARLEHPLKNDPAGVLAGSQEQPGRSKDKGVPKRPLRQAPAYPIEAGRAAVLSSGPGSQVELPERAGRGDARLFFPLTEAAPVHFTPDPAGKLYGVYPALVTDNHDPDDLNRVKIVYPWMIEPEYIFPYSKNTGYWARLATLMAGYDKGSWFIPDIGDEVLVAFEGGDPSHPYVIGALWNGSDTPPESQDSENSRKVIQTRRGVKIFLDDAEDHERLVLETPRGQKITLADGDDSVSIENVSSNNRIILNAHGIFLHAESGLHISTPGQVKIDTVWVEFSGVVKCDTLKTKHVESETYTPGTGNIF